jgi:type I restriction-modification system DNA methylase subunit
MSVPKEVSRLIEKFNQHLESYRSGKYNEAQLRNEFLNPFFKALGWDMDNDQGLAEAYKDVVHEDAIRIGGAVKAPDYCFRIGGTRKFFLEAKKPSVDIGQETSAAFQLRRYAWSAKLPLSILSDFEEFAVYDCRVKPNKSDSAATARVFLCRFQVYPEKWEWISSIFSKEAILKGSFDKYAEENKAKRGTSEVDDDFLATIERWRSELAKNLAVRNSRLSQRELNFAVQRIIDRIIFLRICEDRGIEPYGRLQGLTNGANIYPRLCEVFEDADAKYNSGLFNFQAEKGRHEPPDEITLGLELDDKLLRSLLRDLYYPESPYEFTVISSDILGQAYEQFLGKVIRLTEGHHAVVEDKPEVKKAGGVYYTPAYIVDYIVKQTVGKITEGKTPKQVSKLRILDPACGSGSFLINAYQFLLDWHRDWYFAHKPETWTKGRNPVLVQTTAGWKLTIAERKRILLDNIYGVDIDAQAVEVTKLSLLLKVLEGESEQTIQPYLRLFSQRALPDLGNNIKCGNSLIGPEYFSIRLHHDSEDLRSINPFDWTKEYEIALKQENGFSCVIGNPPYGMVVFPELKQFFEGTYESVEGRIDNYEVFIEKGVSLCGKNGILGFIVPSPLLSNLYSRKLRRWILRNCDIKEITNFGIKVFSGPTIHTCIIILKRGSSKNNSIKIRVQVAYGEQLKEAYDYEIKQINIGKNENATFDIFFDPRLNGLLEKMSRKGFSLGDRFYLRQCIKTGNDDEYVKVSPVNLAYPWKVTLRGRSIQRYSIVEKNLFLKYGPWLARNWKNVSFYETQKIIVRETGNRIIATIDMKNRYILSSLYGIYAKSPAEPVSLFFLLGILNSKLATFYLKKTALDLSKGAFTKMRTNQLARLPIYQFDPQNKQDVVLIKAVEDNARKILKLCEEQNKVHDTIDGNLFRRQFEFYDKQIEHLVYQLYRLTDEEIRIVEEATAPAKS